jgi:hypothetical protein
MRLIKYAARLQPWIPDIEIKYKPGRMHGNADYVSRNTTPIEEEDRQCDLAELVSPYAHPLAITSAVTNTLGNEPPWEKPCEGPMSDYVKRVLNSQKQDEFCNQVCTALAGASVSDGAIEYLRKTKRLPLNFKLIDGVLYYITTLSRSSEAPNEVVKRLVLPKEMRDEVLTYFHNNSMSGHMGSTKVRSKIQRRFYWPGHVKDIVEWCNTCPLCQTYRDAQPSKHGHLQPKNISYPFHTLSIDLFGPLPTHRGNKYILTVIDCFTRYCFIIPIKNKLATTVADALYKHIFVMFSAPVRILNDQGGEFENQIMERLCSRWGVDKVRTSALHPQTNSQVERLHRYIRKSLSILTHETKHWGDYTDEVAYSYRVTPISGLGYSPYEILTGCEPRLPYDILMGDQANNVVDEQQYLITHHTRLRKVWEIVRDTQKRVMKKAKTLYDNKHKSVIYEVGDRVLIYRQPDIKGPNFFESHWLGPFIIVDHPHSTDISYYVCNDVGRVFPVHVKNLYAYKQRVPNDSNIPNSKSNITKTTANIKTKKGVKTLKTKTVKQVRFADEEEKPSEDPNAELGTTINEDELITQCVEVFNYTNPYAEVKTSDIPGLDPKYPYGVFAKKGLEKDKCIGEYKGDILDDSLFMTKYPKGDARYVFGLNNGIFIDASDPTKGNITRFINCNGQGDEPNLYAHEIDGRLFFLTTREILPGEELLYDYGDNYFWENLDGIGRGKTNELPVNPPIHPISNIDMSHIINNDDMSDNEILINENENDDCMDFKHENDDRKGESEPEINNEKHHNTRSRNKVKTQQNRIKTLPKKISTHKPFRHEDGMMVIYDLESERLVGKILWYDPKADLLEVHRFGTYSKKPTPNTIYKPTYRDTKDDKLVHTLKPLQRCKAYTDYVHPNEVVYRDWFISNKETIPGLVLMRSKFHG